MAWVNLTVDQIQNSLSSSERMAMSEVDSAALLGDIVQSVTALVIGKVNSWGPNHGNLGPTGTIPDESLAAAIAIARYKFLTSLPGTQLITKWREQENTQAYQLLDQIATGALRIVSAIAGVGVTQNPAASSPGQPGETSGEPFWAPYPIFTPGGSGPWPDTYW